MITVLKEMPVTNMTKVVGDSVTRQETPHKFWKTRRSTSYQEMSMVAHQGPGIDPGFRFLRKITQAVDKVFPVFIVINDSPFFNPSEDHVMEGSGSIESRLTGHTTSFWLLNFVMSISIS
jgi:hypothetical protein